MSHRKGERRRDLNGNGRPRGKKQNRALRDVHWNDDWLNNKSYDMNHFASLKTFPAGRSDMGVWREKQLTSPWYKHNTYTICSHNLISTFDFSRHQRRFPAFSGRKGEQNRCVYRPTCSFRFGSASKLCFGSWLVWKDITRSFWYSRARRANKSSVNGRGANGGYGMASSRKRGARICDNGTFSAI